MKSTTVVEAKGHSHGAARPKKFQTTVPATQVSIFQVNPGVWKKAVEEAKKHGVKVPNGITIISTTKVEFLCAR